MDVLNHGGPPLLGSKIPWERAEHLAAPPVYPANYGDDEGIYLYLPVAGHLLHASNPLVLLKWFFIGCMGLLVLAYPFVFYAIFGSISAAVVAPWVVAYRFAFLRNTDIYWMSAWILLFAVPLLLLAFRLRRDHIRTSIALLVGADVAASFASSVRSGAGTPIFIASLFVAYFVIRSWRLRLVTAIGLFLANYSVSTGLFALVRLYRDHEVKMPAAMALVENSHSLWHPAYLGLGYLPNKFGIKWDDVVAMRAAQHVDPGIVYLSPHYNSILRHLYFNIVKSDPGFVFHTYFVKFAETLNGGLSRFAVPLIILPAACILGRKASVVRAGALLTVPGIITTLIPPVIALPAVYSTGWLGAVGMLEILVVAWLATNIEWLAKSRRGFEWQRLFEQTPVPLLVEMVRGVRPDVLRVGRTAGISILAVACAAAIVFPVRRATASVLRENSPLETRQVLSSIPAPPSPGPSVYRTALRSRLAPGWSATVGTTLAWSDRRVSVTTTPISDGYQLASGALKLRPGNYTVNIRGAVDSGGLSLAVADLKTQRFLAQSSYWSGQEFGPDQQMAASFTVPHSTSVRVILMNWQFGSGTSRWTLSQFVLKRSAKPAPP